MTNTKDLIDSLTAEAKPVRRLRPPLLRAVVWLSACVSVIVVAAWVRDAWPAMLEHLGDQHFAIEMISMIVTGVTAIIAAFYLSLPDRSSLWLLLPMPSLAVWLGSSGYECYQNWLVLGPDNSLAIGPSFQCLSFIVLTSLPLAFALYVALRRAHPLDALPAMISGGLGIAALAAATLQFYHPFDVTVIDLSFHVFGVAIVTGMLAVFGKTGMRFQPSRAP